MVNYPKIPVLLVYYRTILGRFSPKKFHVRSGLTPTHFFRILFNFAPKSVIVYSQSSEVPPRQSSSLRAHHQPLHTLGANDLRLDTSRTPPPAHMGWTQGGHLQVQRPSPHGSPFLALPRPSSRSSPLSQVQRPSPYGSPFAQVNI